MVEILQAITGLGMLKPLLTGFTDAWDEGSERKRDNEKDFISWPE